LARVAIENLTKKFGDVTAVANLDLTIEDRTFVVLLGPSGCGKTTTLRCVAGLESPDNGEVYIGDRKVTDLDPKDRDIAMVFQSYALYPHMTVYDNISFPLRIRKKSKDEVRSAVEKVGELLRVKHLLNRRPRQLSGGEQQRVALGRSLVREPSVFLMDEPLSNLDAKLRLYMRAELKRLQKELGITTVYVTHDQAEAMTMADKIALLENGILQQYESPEDIYNKPTNTFVAGFLGSPPMNFFGCSLTERNGLQQLEGHSYSFQISRDLANLIKQEISEPAVIVGIRPEDITLSKEATPSKQAIKSEIYVVEPMGSTTIVDMKVGDEIYKVCVPGTFKAPIGDKLFMCFTDDRMHIFDAKNQEKIA
jgi:multiple sugar transport system ATP-binding protein